MTIKKIIASAAAIAAMTFIAGARTYPPPFNQYPYATNLTGSNAFAPGKIVVYRIGEIADTNFNIASVRQQPAFIEEWDPVLTNQSAPLLSIALPTNDPNNTVFVNAKDR